MPAHAFHGDQTRHAIPFKMNSRSDYAHACDGRGACSGLHGGGACREYRAAPGALCKRRGGATHLSTSCRFSLLVEGSMEPDAFSCNQGVAVRTAFLYGKPYPFCRKCLQIYGRIKE